MPEVEILERLTLINSDIDLSDNISFIIQLTVISLFSMMLMGFAIKKLMQVIKG